MTHGDPVTTVTDIKARTESMVIGTLASRGFSEIRHFIVSLVDSLPFRTGFVIIVDHFIVKL